MKQSHLDLLIVFLAECIGTGLLVFIGCLRAVENDHYKPSHLSVALGFGLAVMLIINIFGMVTGAHLNPVVTLGAFIYKLVSVPTAISYCLGQMLGGYLGYGLLRILLPISDNGFCVSQPTIDTAKAFGLEFMITSILMMVYCGVVDPRNANHHDSVPLRFGLTVTCMALVAGPFSGGSMNPARSFGPALYSGVWKHQWLYWAAPFSASLITVTAFRMIFYKAPLDQRNPETLPLNDKDDV
nr:Rpip1 aquaporin transcript variant B [Belgica antarctica]